MDGLAIEQDLTTAGAKTAADEVEQRGLARAIGADDSHALTALHGQADAPDDFGLAEFFVHVLEFKGVTHKAVSLRLISFSMSVCISDQSRAN